LRSPLVARIRVLDGSAANKLALGANVEGSSASSAVTPPESLLTTAGSLSTTANESRRALARGIVVGASRAELHHGVVGRRSGSRFGQLGKRTSRDEVASVADVLLGSAAVEAVGLALLVSAVAIAGLEVTLRAMIAGRLVVRLNAAHKSRVALARKFEQRGLRWAEIHAIDRRDDLSRLPVRAGHGAHIRVISVAAVETIGADAIVAVFRANALSAHPVLVLRRAIADFLVVLTGAANEAGEAGTIDTVLPAGGAEIVAFDTGDLAGEEVLAGREVLRHGGGEAEEGEDGGGEGGGDHCECCFCFDEED